MSIKVDSLKQFETGPRGGKYVITAAGLKRYVVGIEEQRADTNERLKSAMASKASDTTKSKFGIVVSGAGDEIPKGRAWQDEPPPGFKGAEEGGTRAMNYVGYKSDKEPGVPSPERQLLHDKIKAGYLDKVSPAEGKPHAILMMGGTASGKSSMVKGSEIPESKYVKIDADGIKDQIPEYKAAVQQNFRYAAGMAHEESSELAKSIRATAVAQGKNILFDGTGANAVKYTQLIDELHGRGYHVTVMMTDLTADEGMRRADMRAQHSGRYVDPQEVKKIYASVPKSFEIVHKQADDFELWDNHGKEARPVQLKRGGMERTIDKVYVAAFHKRAGG